MKRHDGFTLIELIIVIVILGILAAYAIPKYMNIDKEARASVVKGLEGSVKAAAEMVHAIALSKGSTGTVNIGSGDVAIGTGRYPLATNAGIGAAIADISAFNVTLGTNTITYAKKGATTEATCSVTYNIADANLPATTSDTAGC